VGSSVYSAQQLVDAGADAGADTDVDDGAGTEVDEGSSGVRCLIPLSTRDVEGNNDSER
jgi:hypothetical protein